MMHAKHIAETARYYLDNFLREEADTIAEAKENGERVTGYCFYRFTELEGNQFECTFDPDWYDEEDGWELWARERVV